ncbi:hypothetical protein NQ315_000545 [Exocentrus adspersus]|uniref:Uncharacterized protein n=1 Tax=Exocentrus adspersus TaxID=1586481 RepID=A0AAV8VA67_9CUCU|nr:hypothetical protein NQ315_000545 [Exocentrus adspersus]
MDAPPVADLRKDLELDCHFDMGVEELYAVKWYKDDQEFFRKITKSIKEQPIMHIGGMEMQSQSQEPLVEVDDSFPSISVSPFRGGTGGAALVKTPKIDSYTHLSS